MDFEETWRVFFHGCLVKFMSPDGPVREREEECRFKEVYGILVRGGTRRDHIEGKADEGVSRRMHERTDASFRGALSVTTFAGAQMASGERIQASRRDSGSCLHCAYSLECAGGFHNR